MKTKLIMLFMLIGFAAFSQSAPITLKKAITVKGITINHCIAAEVNQNYFENKTTVIMIPYATKADRLISKENCFREFAKIVKIDSTGYTRAQLKVELQKPKWVKTSPTDSTQTNFF